MKILIIKLSSLGDIIHAFSAVSDIKRYVPQAKITWLVDHSFAELITINKYVDEVITIPLRAWKKHSFIIAIIKTMSWVIRARCAARQFDYIVDMQGLLKSAVLSLAFRGVRYGFNYSCVKEKIASLFYAHKIDVSKLNAVHKLRDLASKIFGYIYSKEIDFGIADVLDHNDHYVIIVMFASNISKQYAIDNWLVIINALCERNFRVMMLFGSQRERSILSIIRDRIDKKDMIIIPNCIYNFKQLVTLFKNAIFVFGVDTGLTHLANALHKPQAAIFVSTDSLKTGIQESDCAINFGGIGTPPAPQVLIEHFISCTKYIRP